MSEHGAGILESHLNRGEFKPVSYLPSKTITKVLGMTLDSYMAMARDRGFCCISPGPGESRINSGAVYVFDDVCLNCVLAQRKDVLSENGWPFDNAAFIRRMATDRLDGQNPILPVIRRVFGDL